jgi:hypothetical protein
MVNGYTQTHAAVCRKETETNLVFLHIGKAHRIRELHISNHSEKYSSSLHFDHQYRSADFCTLAEGQGQDRAKRQ